MLKQVAFKCFPKTEKRLFLEINSIFSLFVPTFNVMNLKTASDTA